VNRPSRRAFAGQMLAYVDDCLPREDRQALESAMAESPEIRRQIEEWLRQNQAIRATFAEPAARSAPPAAGRFAAAAFVPARAARAAETKRQSDDADLRRPAIATMRERHPGAAALPAAQPIVRARGRGAAARRISIALACALALWCASALLWPRDPSTGFVAAGAAAYRTFAGNSTRPVEVATKDRAALERWFAAQGAPAAPVPDLSAAGLALIGGRIVPGAFSPAQFMLYENARRERVGVAIEPLDSPPASAIVFSQSGGVPSAAWTGAGHGFVVLGAASGAPIARLARLVRDGEPPTQPAAKQVWAE
jgi:anti-sigma factor RsiW